MAQFNSLLVTGDSRFLNPINGNARNGVYYVKGTQTAATGSWTGVIPIPVLYDGLTIMYYLPYAGSGNATLNLTLSNGTTTGAINCYYSTTRLSTHYAKGSNIVMTYHPAGSISVDGTDTTDDRWIANANYDTNDGQYYDRYTNYRTVAGANKVFPYTIVCRLPDGRWESIVTSASTGTSKSRNTHGFLFGEIAVMYANATYAENAEIGTSSIWDRYGNLIDHRYSFNTANNATNGLTAIKPVYLVGSLGADGLYYLANPWWTQTLPSTADGKIYTHLGEAYDYYRMTFNGTGRSYVYTNGHLREFGQDAATIGGKDLPTSATSNTTGISIADHSTGSVTGVQSSTTTASKVTLGTAFTVPNVTAKGSGSFTSGAFSGGSGSFTATVTNGVLSFSHTHTAATHGADSHTHTAPTLGTAFTIPNVTAATDVTVPIKDTSSTTVVTSKTHSITDNGHTHTLS